MTDLTIPDEAVAAAAEALHADGCPECAEGDSERCPGWDMTREAEVALTAALPHLHPTIPNPVDGLDALPEGAVIRGELLPGVAIVCEKWADRWLVTGEPESYDSRDLARVWQDIATWTVLWPLGGAA